ncbi:unnamed protein product [Spirodela intermedia]|uniref:Lipoyl-binding domain-containing protein n=1 Tax=Spirodela intermedia TaxID=51605 RepID=A0A7I8JRD2_SPIIN|nr:unnamed protein product [Spirodela intermedia]CAA6672679.1 unnamed protein product [Spirodela intermedia]
MNTWNIGGAMSVRILNIDIYRNRCATLETQNGAKICQQNMFWGLRDIQIKQQQVRFADSTRKPWRLSRLENPSRDPVEEKKSGSAVVPFTPNSSQVESLVTDICDTTSIAEFELDFGGFRLYLKRGLEEKGAPHHRLRRCRCHLRLPWRSTTTSLAISKTKPSSTGVQRFLDTASDEGLAILQSPKVGFFRRSRTIKGKRAPPSCQERQVVKEGQILCYIEQLGGEIPIESDVSGEVIKILRQDGEPVGYGDALIAVLPSFPGIKKLQ